MASDSSHLHHYHLTVRSRLTPAVVGMCAIVISLVGCGGEPDRDPIRLQANAVGGGQIFVSDLASQDTVLWFWAPW